MKKRNVDYTMFSHNQFNRVNYDGKYRFKKVAHRLKRTDMFLMIKWKTELREHHNDNSYYYFEDQYKGRIYLYIHGSGILELRTDTYVKKFDGDPILGWGETYGKR